jgi:iron complex outermembrane receptor protein
MTRTSGTILTLAGVAALGAAACVRHASENPAPADSVETGFGVQQAKGKATGAVTTIDEDNISKKPLAIEDLLRGKVPGLQIVHNGNQVSFRIRGTSSMNANSSGTFGADREPLVIVDGIPIQEGNIANALAGLTTDDIKQINVLKDVASTSVYGVRGSAGVILITTKLKSPPDTSTA